MTRAWRHALRLSTLPPGCTVHIFGCVETSGFQAVSCLLHIACRLRPQATARENTSARKWLQFETGVHIKVRRLLCEGLGFRQDDPDVAAVCREFTSGLVEQIVGSHTTYFELLTASPKRQSLALQGYALTTS